MNSSSVCVLSAKTWKNEGGSDHEVGLSGKLSVQDYTCMWVDNFPGFLAS